MADRAQKAQKGTSPAAGAEPAAKDPYAAPGQQPPANLLLGQVTPELAISEFAKITNAINLVGVEPEYQTSPAECPGEGAKWCLPDANCTARVTMDGKTRQAFTANREFCSRLVVE